MVVPFTVHWKDVREGDEISVPSEDSLVAVESIGAHKTRVYWLERVEDHDY